MSAPSQVKYVRKSVSQISLPHFSPNHAAVLITAVIIEIVKVMVIDRKIDKQYGNQYSNDSIICNDNKH